MMMKPRSYAMIEPIPPTWLWAGRLPLKTVTVLVGQEGIGKGFLGSDLAARVTRGEDMPDGTEGVPTGNVIMITPEDDQHSAMAYRLRAADADLSRVFDFTEGFLLPDASALHALVKHIGDVRLIWIDPLSYFAPLTSSNSRVRKEVIAPLEQIAREFDLAIVAVVHTTKAGRTAGSKAITEAARMVLRVSRARTEKTVRVIAVDKTNIGADTIADIAYTILGRWPDVRVDYFEVTDDAIADDDRPVPLRNRITEVLRASQGHVATRDVYERLLDRFLLTPDDIKYGAVRVALLRLGRDPFSEVYSPRAGMWSVRRDDGPILGLPAPADPGV